MTDVFTARWILPMGTPPIRDGWIATDRDVIAAVGDGPPPAGTNVRDYGDAVILPGLVNAHTHLELSWMRGQVPPADSMAAWAARLMALRRTVSQEPAAPIVEAVAGVRAAGTALVGDVTNTLAAYDALADSDLAGAIFRELLGFSATDPDAAIAAARAQLDALMPLAWWRASIVPHAPYSVSPALFRALAAIAGDVPVSVHLGESSEEIQFLRDGTGPWRDLLRSLGVWNDAWVPPGCGPVEYLDRLGLVGPRLLAVHGTQFTRDDVERLAEVGATIVTCPRSNRWTGAGRPPLDVFYESGARVAVGTDSLASVEDLNVFAELAEIRRLAPSIPPHLLLESATIRGAEALGFATEYGTIAPGKRAAIIVVPVPRGTDDVEEYLLTGIEPDAVRWVRDSP